MLNQRISEYSTRYSIQFCVFQIDFYMAITSILNFDITSGKLNCPGYMLVSWTDEQLVWNISQHSGITYLNLHSGDIWTPRFVQTNNQRLDDSLAPVWVYSNGTTLWMIGAVFEGLCDLNVEAYPIDSHFCSFFIQPSVSDTSGLRIRLSSNGSDQVNFTEHGEWEITKTTTEVLTLKEPVSGISYSGVSKTLKLSRRYIFIMLHTLFPIFLIGWLYLFIFIVPLKSGERITFAVTVLLTFIVLISEISDQLPHNSLKLSVVSIGMTFVSVLCTLATITSVILCRMANETIMPVPKTLIQLTRKLVAMKRSKCGGQKTRQTSVRRLSEPDDSNEGHISKEEIENISNDENIEVDWETAANMLDIIMFYVNLVTVMVGDTIIISLFFYRQQ